MGGLFDLLFLALILWWIFRALGGGRRSEDEGRPEAPPERRRAGGQAAADEPEWRRRLKEAVREWEVEQRRRAGEPVPESETPRRHAPASPGRPGEWTAHPERPLDREAHERPAGVTARTEAPDVRRQEYGRRLEERPGLTPASKAPPGPARREPPAGVRPEPATVRRQPTGRPAPRPRARVPDGRPRAAPPRPGDGRFVGSADGGPTRRDLGPAIGERGDAGDVAGALEAPAAGPRRRGADLPALTRLSHLQRAILYQEILGPPRTARAPDHQHWF